MTELDRFVLWTAIAMLVALAVIAIVSRIGRRADEQFLVDRQTEIDENLAEYLRERKRREHAAARAEFRAELERRQRDDGA